MKIININGEVVTLFQDFGSWVLVVPDLKPIACVSESDALEWLVNLGICETMEEALSFLG